MKKIIVAIAALALMASSAYAADWNFYGEAKIYTFWAESDVIDGASGDWQYGEGLYGSSKIGANVTVSDELTARFEYGACDGNANIRHLYGVWNFGAGSLLVGQSDTPLNVAYSNQFASQDDLGLAGYGDLDNSRNPEIMLTFGGFSIAFIAPEKNAWVYPGIAGTAFEDPLTNDDDDTVTAFGANYDTQAIIPMIALAYKATFNMGEVQIAGGYNTFEINDDEDISAYTMAIGTNLNFGAFGMFATFVWGQNMGNLGADNGTGYEGLAIYDGTDVYDCESIGGTIGVTFAINEMFALEAGYGYIHDELDDNAWTGTVSNISQSYYLQAPITLAPGVTVIPEVGMIDQTEAGENEILYFGAAWAIAF